MNKYCIWVVAPSFIFYFNYFFKHCFFPVSSELNFLLRKSGIHSSCFSSQHRLSVNSFSLLEITLILCLLLKSSLEGYEFLDLTFFNQHFEVILF